jgi:hypothetical protein
MKRRSLVLAALLGLIVAGLAIAVSCTPTATQKDCVVWIGDSIFALSGEEANALEELSNQSYRTYYVSGAQMEGGLVRTIPAQYDQADRADSNIRTVIMNGGGNDVLIGANGSCDASYPNGTLSRACYDIIDKVEAVNNALWQDMINDGVKNIVNQGYYYSSDRDLWVVSDVFQNRTKQEFANMAAKNPSIKMVFIEPKDNPYFDKSRVSTYTISDGIHPTDAASAELANMLWDAMVANDIEQTTSCSGSSSSSSSGGCN